MKVDSKVIVPFINTLKSLLEDYQSGMKECEDKEQCEDTFEYINEQITTLITSFKVENLTPVIKNQTTSPSFILTYERISQNQSASQMNNLTGNDEKIWFMAKLYYAIKRKLEVDGVENIYDRDKISFHIYHYLLDNDDKWNYYFNTALADSAYKVIDTVVDEIIETRRKNPQITLNLEQSVEKANSKKLINWL